MTMMMMMMIIIIIIVIISSSTTTIIIIITTILFIIITIIITTTTTTITITLESRLGAAQRPAVAPVGISKDPAASLSLSIYISIMLYIHDYI